MSIIIGVCYNWLSVRNEHRNRLLFAEKLLKNDDAEALQTFEKWHNHIMHYDSLILCKKTDEDTKIEQLKKTFDPAFFENYIVDFFFCDPYTKLELSEETFVDCHAFFEERILQQGRSTANENLFEICRNPFDFNYLGVVKISDSQELYIEFVSKEKISWMQNMLKENRYSAAFYDHSELIKQIGAFDYPLKLFTPKNKQDKTFSEYEKFSHLLMLTEDLDDERVLIVSSRIPRFQNRFSTFSFVFILNLCLALLILIVWKRASRAFFRTFAQRLQITVLGIVLATFITVGITSVIYVQNLNLLKNQKVLHEKTHSLLLLMELRFGDKTPIEILENSTLLQRKLNEFSEVIFTDIFFYDETGYIIAKSVADEVFWRSLGNEMSPQAYHQLSREHKNFYIRKEMLNEHSYYSSYVPFRNNQNELVGYLNLPHLEKQTELRYEISAFVMAYINMFVVLIILAFLLVFLIIKRLTKPLVDSERQIAWNEMAKQIAHEIKNPLTPMKLNVQQIQKAWNDDRKDDFDNRMKHFSTVMIEQIETLSAIASEFSNFAQQPNVELTEIDIKKCLGKAILLMNTDDVIQFETSENIENTTVLADEKQLSRALVNILKNAKQAVSELENPQIKVSLSVSDIGVVIAIRNNGKGIPVEIRDRIFEPSFTTKTSGMGLGLAITKNIIERFNGTISFDTDETSTVFFVQLPRI
jgi:signal transduction histidine kinase